MHREPHFGPGTVDRASHPRSDDGAASPPPSVRPARSPIRLSLRSIRRLDASPIEPAVTTASADTHYLCSPCWPPPRSQ